MIITSSLTDFTSSVEKALEEIDSEYKNYNGIIITGTHRPLDVEQKLDLITMARENKVPILGICMGMQLMAIEYARNVLKIADATSEEIGAGTWVVKKMPQLRVGLFQTLRDGEVVFESFWHHYYVVPEYAGGFICTFATVEQGAEVLEVVDSLRLMDHPFFMGVQFHPEYQSSEEKRHPILAEFINKCKEYAR